MKRALREHLVGVTPATEDSELQAAVHAARYGDTKAPRRVGTLLSTAFDHKSDTAVSWFLLGALSGDEICMDMVMHHLLEGAMETHVEARIRRRCQAHALHLRRDYLRRAHLAALWAELRQSYVIDLVARERQAQTPNVGSVHSGGTTATGDGKPCLKVLGGPIGDPKGPEGRQIARRYESLEAPLPLAGADVDPEIIHAVLRGEFPWLESLVDRVRETLRLRRYAGAAWFKLPPMLLVGPPGTGKSMAARRLAELSGTGFLEISAAGSDDVRYLKGTARGWASAQPAAPVVAMQHYNIANPIVLVDEVDKAGQSNRNGRIVDTLLAMLEPENAKRFFDECLLTHCDLSQISWLATANSLEGLPTPLLSRLSIVRVNAPGPDHFPAVLRGLQQNLATELGVRAEELPCLGEQAERMLQEALQRSGDVRAIRRAYERALAVSAKSQETVKH